MSELLPDMWNLQEEERGYYSRCITHRAPVLCWPSGTKYPDKVTHFMIYQRNIINEQSPNPTKSIRPRPTSNYILIDIK